MILCFLYVLTSILWLVSPGIGGRRIVICRNCELIRRRMRGDDPEVRLLQFKYSKIYKDPGLNNCEVLKD